ncbi:MAG: Amino-acid carrier protein AlsT [Chlamydiae bacterium]|nr:Amino-acid carrier protein AlsT [Chlamydiota bacterium]
MELSLLKGLTLFNEGLVFYLIFPAILLLGLYLTVRLRFIQISKLGGSCRHLVQKQESETGITHYQAVAAVLAGNFGTGNISGMAVAVATGGAGALVWMWVMAFLGSTIQYASCVLGAKHRTTNKKGQSVGGPMYYLPKKVGALYAFFAVVGALTVGNLTQVNSIVLPLESLGVPPIVAGLAIALFVGIVLIGGVQRFAKTAASVVPIMALLYFGTAVFILGLHIDAVPRAFILMIQAAFSPTALFGGALGFGIIKTITTGFDRGIFATDAGTGLAPILQSGTGSQNPIVNGIVTLVTPMIVMIVCTATGLVLIVTGAYEGLERSTNMVTAAFSSGLGSNIGSYIVILALLLFSYTTILAWGSCAERAIEYLFQGNGARRFRFVYIAIVPLGALVDVQTVWLLADISITLMLATNMFGVARLSHEVIHDSRQYFSKKVAV